MAARKPHHGFGSSRCRFWLRHEGQRLRFLSFNEPSEDGEGRIFLKRITHRRFRPGRHLAHGRYNEAMARWYADLPADVWVEVAKFQEVG